MGFILFALGFACGALVTNNWNWIVRSTTKKEGK